MALTTTDLAGPRTAPAAPAVQVQVEVVRAVMADGARQEPGAVLTVTKTFAAELIGAGKARPYVEAATPPEAKPKADPKPAATKKES